MQAKIGIQKQILETLAVGLLQQYNPAMGQSNLPITQLNPDLRRGWEQLCAVCLQNGITPPGKLRELVLWLHTPIEQWDVTTDDPTVDQTQAFLEDGLPTAFCEELGGIYVNAPDPYLEIQDGPFKNIYAIARQIGNPEQYALVRTFIGRNPILEDRIAQISANADWDSAIRTELLQCYEAIPPQCHRVEAGKKYVYVCPRCGWALRWRGDEAICYRDERDKPGVCGDLIGDLAANAKRIPYKPGMACTTEGIQRYVVAPEIELFRLHDRLKAEWGAILELYPDFDLFDLLVKFPNGAIWAIDLKDYANPVLLARRLNERPFAWGQNWTRAFYLFPDYRATPSYLNQFGNGWTPQKDVTFLSATAFLALAREELAR